MIPELHAAEGSIGDCGKEKNGPDASDDCADRYDQNFEAGSTKTASEATTRVWIGACTAVLVTFVAAFEKTPETKVASLFDKEVLTVCPVCLRACQSDGWDQERFHRSAAIVSIDAKGQRALTYIFMSVVQQVLVDLSNKFICLC